MRKYKVYCPDCVGAFDCPYFKDGECGIENPMNECDDFGALYDEDCISYDEVRTAFEED